jgi:hypothetical protein
MMQLATVFEDRSLPGSRRQTKDEATTLDVRLSWNGAPVIRQVFRDRRNLQQPMAVVGARLLGLRALRRHVGHVAVCMALRTSRPCPAMAS